MHLKNKDHLGIFTKLEGKGFTFWNLNVRPNYPDINLQITKTSTSIPDPIWLIYTSSLLNAFNPLFG
jgi:hypothetical protein